MQILIPGRQFTYTIQEALENRAKPRRIPLDCLYCDSPLEIPIEPCKCGALTTFALMYINMPPPMYLVLRWKEPMTPELLVKSLKTAQQWSCLSCDRPLEADGICSKCDAQTRVEVKIITIEGVGALRHTSTTQCCAILSAVPMVAPNSQIPQIHKSTVFQPKVCVYRITRETNTTLHTLDEPETHDVDVATQTDAEQIIRLHNKGHSLRKIEQLTNFSLGKIRYQINKMKRRSEE